MEMSVHSKEDILERLRQLGPELRELGVERLGLFGSFQRVIHMTRAMSIY